MNCKKSFGRVSVQHPTRATSDLLRCELNDLGLLGSGASANSKLLKDHLDADKGYWDLYCTHPVVQKAFQEGFRQEHVVPLSVYFDGVQYTKNENFLGFYMTNLRSGKQQLVWLLRLSELCSCGCRGWCSVFPLLEHFRCDMSREHTDIRPAILDFKADWPALVEICGLRTWSHNLHPCPCCKVDKSSLLAVGTHSLNSSPNPLFTQSSYDELVARTFREVIVPDDESQRRLHSLLRYSKNGRGRCLKAAFPPLGLRRGHRLEPSEHLLDVDNFIHLTTPFSCIFYTGGTHGRILHRSPFLRIPGVSIDCWCIDVLHTWHFGPLSSYVAHSLRTLISSPVYQPTSYKDLEKEEADKLALLHLRAELWSFYKRRRESDEDWKRKGSEVWNLTLTMIAGKYLKAKAAETHGLLNFVVDRLAKHSEQLASTTEAASVDLLLRAGTAAMDFDAVLAAHPRAVDADTCALLSDNYNRFICLSARAQIPLMPKCHMMYHMIQRALLKGNPRFYSTYIDESLNGAIARVCRSVHRRGWALAVYRKLSMFEQLLAEDED
ncbi:unnamed protein product [Symbiodinium sp. CCMP2592]|nr:unnamed protein product [Symbiodinium sp. CCMP2592]